MSTFCRGRVCINVAALRSVLGDTGIVEAMERKASGRPTVNAAQMWRYFTTSVYSSGDLPVIATREALQNAADAIRAAIRERQIAAKAGLFEVRWDEQARSLSWSDNGIGMDTATILDKFLSLGNSGKSGATSSSEAAGGFGVAKAVILGVSETFRWELRTRDNLAVSSVAAEDVAIFDAEPRQGTEITVFDVPSSYEQRYSYPRNRAEPLLERLRLVLAANDLPELRLLLNGEEVRPLFARRGGSRIAEGGAWGNGTTAVVRAYRRPPGERGGAFYIRIGGLFQFDRSSSAQLPADVVVDLTTSVRPGSTGYPLNAARDALQAAAQWALQDVISEVEKENESAGHAQDYEIFLPDSTGEVADATRAALQDPALQQSLRLAATGLADYYRAMSQQPLTVAEATSEAPKGSRGIQAAEQSEMTATLQSLTSADAGIPAAVDTVRQLLGSAKALDAETEDALQRVTSGALSKDDAQLVATALDHAAAQAVEEAMQPGGAGLLQASATQQALAPLQQLLPATTQRISPFGQLAGLRISKKNYDRRRATRFRTDFAKWLPYLVAWDGALRLVAAEGRIRRRFTPGFVLDDTVNALVGQELTPSGARHYVVYVHPVTLRTIVQAHKHRPLAIAFWLHALACHELTHLDGRMGDGHSESFVTAREELGFATAHILAPIATLIARVLQLPSADALSADKMTTQAIAKVEQAVIESMGRDRALVRQWFTSNRPLLRLAAQLLAQLVRAIG